MINSRRRWSCSSSASPLGSSFTTTRTRIAVNPTRFQGVTRRGPVGRLVLSELAMADEMPEEFLRRITQGEAGYYDVAMVEATASGRLVVLFDAGPDQLGVARIGHLATILLLWRKAERAGVAREIGTLQRPGDTAKGELRDLVMWWLRSLLCRTDDPGVLISVSVPGPNHATTPRPKRRSFSGPVIAAGYIGARTVAVTYVDHQLVVEVIGNNSRSWPGCRCLSTTWSYRSPSSIRSDSMPRFRLRSTVAISTSS